MSEEWIYEHAGRVHGPVSLADLRASLALGLVWPTDLVRRRIIQDWAPATRFPELQGPQVPRLEPESRPLDALGTPPDSPQPKPASGREQARGFTLVELLVVIAIIGTLVGLLLPAVQAAREAARRTSCANNVRQIAVGMMAFESANAHLPSGGWAWTWTADPDRGSSPEQPAGWLYAILPFIEETLIYNLGADTKPNEWTATQLAGAAKRAVTPIPLLNCPSRRSAGAFGINWVAETYSNNVHTPYGSDSLTKCARSDYAANAGDTYTDIQHLIPVWPRTLSEADDFTKTGQWPQLGLNATGISHMRSRIRLKDVADGTTKTYLVGEKYLNPASYADGSDGADNESMYGGFNNDSHRSTYHNPNSGVSLAPMQDTRGLMSYDTFGSAHAAGYFTSYCDGSVRLVTYTIDPETHRRFGNRMDGLPTGDY